MAKGDHDNQPFKQEGGLVPLTKSFHRSLLPYERELCSLIGCTTEEYEQFLKHLEKNAYIRPAEYHLVPEIYNGPETWTWLGPLLISLAVGVATTAVSYFLTPRPGLPDDSSSRSITRRGRTGQDRFLQSTSFDGFADLAEFGDAIPIIWTRYTGSTGGVVVAPLLIWSRAFSLGNQQAAKLVYLVGEAGVQSPDLAGIFIGNTALDVQQPGNYDFRWGGLPTTDASAITGGGTGGGFSACLTPSNSTQFGVANPVPNCTTYRLNWRVVSFPEEVDSKTARDIKNERRKICGFASRNQGMKGVGRGYPRRQGVVSGGKGERGTNYVISGERLNNVSSDFETPTSVRLTDVNDALDAECVSTDEIMQVGEQFVVGEKLVKVVSRSADMWQRGKTVNIALSEPIPGGPADAIYGKEYTTDDGKDKDGSTGKNFGSIYYSLCRAVVAAFRNNRRCEATEIGIKSQVWGRINGLAHFNAIPDPDTLQNYDENNVQFSLGTNSEYVQRISMFRIYYRPSGSSNWAQAGPVLAIRGSTPTDQHHQIRINHGTSAEYEFEIRPVSSAALQEGLSSLYILNSNGPSRSVGALQIKADFSNIYNDRATDDLNSFFEVRQTMATGWGPETGQETYRMPTKAVYYDTRALDLNENPLSIEKLTETKLRNAFLEDIFGEPYFDSGVLPGEETVSLKRETDRGKLVFTIKVVAINIAAEGEDPKFRWDIRRVTVTDARPDSEKSFAVDQIFSYSKKIKTNVKYLRGALKDYPDNRIDVRMRFRITDVKNVTLSAEERGWRRFEVYTAFAEVSHYGSAVTRSCDNGPEHQIVYVNQIGGTSLGSYNNVDTAMLALKSNRNIGSVEQLRLWIKSGVNNSNSFPRLVEYLLTNVRGISPSMIDSSSFAEADSFCNANGLYFDGAITSRTNLRSFITSTAPFFLLNLVMRNGKIALVPALPQGGSAGMFTAGNIIEGSFTLEYLDIAERRSIRAEMIWRENLLNEFPRQRSLVIGSGSETLETFDMSAFCTSEEHARKAGNYIRALRQYVTHAIKFKTTIDNAALGPGSIISVSLNQTSSSRFSNGSISSKGVITSAQNIPDGTYDISYFKPGTSGEQQTGTMPVNKGTTSNSVLYGAIFSVNQSNVYTTNYLVEQVELDEEGLVSISATEYPYNAIASAVGL